MPTMARARQDVSPARLRRGSVRPGTAAGSWSAWVALRAARWRSASRAAAAPVPAANTPGRLVHVGGEGHTRYSEHTASAGRTKTNRRTMTGGPEHPRVRGGVPAGSGSALGTAGDGGLRRRSQSQAWVEGEALRAVLSMSWTGQPASRARARA
ncbi:hypothetical protein GCM10010304_79980 [Streptomyces roseoviolaceus]